jgi:hypothetical protein
MNTRDNPCDRMALALVTHAACNAPADLRDRLGEEWLADLHEQPSPFARLRFALGCCWARQLIAHDALAFGTAAQAATVARGQVLAMPPAGPSLPTRRSLVLLLIAGLHLAVVFAFIYSISNIRPAAPQKPIDGTILPDTTRPPSLPLAVPSFKPEPGVTTLVPTDTGLPPIFYQPPEQGGVDIPPHPPVQPQHVVARVAGGPGKGFPATTDYYPPGAIRLSETGLAVVQVCTDSRGRLTSEPVIATTAGSARLDGGALALAKAGSGHYRSSTEDGTPVAGCFAIRVRFALND